MTDNCSLTTNDFTSVNPSRSLTTFLAALLELACVPKISSFDDLPHRYALWGHSGEVGFPCHTFSGCGLMSNWFSTALLAVEEAGVAAPAGDATGGAAPAGPGLNGILVMLLPVVLVMFVMNFFGNNPRKQASQQLEKLKALKKNDPVVTIGGIRGSFVSLSEDGTEVTLQLSDNNRVRFEASAIRSMPAAVPPAKS